MWTGIWKSLMEKIHVNICTSQSNKSIFKKKCGSVASRLLGLRVQIPPGGIDVCHLWVLCCQVKVCASGRSLVQRCPSESCLSVISKPQQCGGLRPTRAVDPGKPKAYNVRFPIIPESYLHHKCAVRFGIGCYAANIILQTTAVVTHVLS